MKTPPLGKDVKHPLISFRLVSCLLRELRFTNTKCSVLRGRFQVLSKSHFLVQPPLSNSRAFCPPLLSAFSPLACTPWSLATTVAMEMPVWTSCASGLLPREHSVYGAARYCGLCQPSFLLTGERVPARGPAPFCMSTHPLTAFGWLPLWAAVSDAAGTWVCTVSCDAY